MESITTFVKAEKQLFQKYGGLFFLKASFGSKVVVQKSYFQIYQTLLHLFLSKKLLLLFLIVIPNGALIRN